MPSSSPRASNRPPPDEPWLIGAADYEMLSHHAFSRDEHWDIAAIAALFALSNRMASATDMRPNDEFYAMGRERRS